MNVNITMIKKCLQKEFECDKIAVTDGSVYAQNEHIIALVVAPHEGNNYHYLVRFSTKAGFDRWANSRAIEKEFDTVMEVIQYLKENKLEIYKKLLELQKEFEKDRDEFLYFIVEASHTAGWQEAKGLIHIEDDDELADFLSDLYKKWKYGTGKKTKSATEFTVYEILNRYKKSNT